MTKVLAGITVSVDGYVAGPDDRAGKGLGEGGERLHYWVFGGPWSYEKEPTGEPEGEDAAYLDEMSSREGAVVVGRNMYEAADHWGGRNPFPVPIFVVTQPGSTALLSTSCQRLAIANASTVSNSLLSEYACEPFQRRRFQSRSCTLGVPPRAMPLLMYTSRLGRSMRAVSRYGARTLIASTCAWPSTVVVLRCSR